MKTNMTKTEIIEEFKNHPALKFANDAIVLDSLRNGIQGYKGKENLVQFLDRKLTDLLDTLEAEVIDIKFNDLGSAFKTKEFREASEIGMERTKLIVNALITKLKQ